MARRIKEVPKTHVNDIEYIAEALKEARLAYERGECPVGAIFVQNGKIIARSSNEEVRLHDPTAHAEILALRKGGRMLGRHHFPDCTMYTTLWPCPMCENALLQAQVPRVVTGASTFAWISETRFKKENIVRVGPIMEEECRSIFIDWLRKNDRREILEREGL